MFLQLYCLHSNGLAENSWRQSLLASFKVPHWDSQCFQTADLIKSRLINGPLQSGSRNLWSLFCEVHQHSNIYKRQAHVTFHDNVSQHDHSIIDAKQIRNLQGFTCFNRDHNDWVRVFRHTSDRNFSDYAEQFLVVSLPNLCEEIQLAHKHYSIWAKLYFLNCWSALSLSNRESHKPNRWANGNCYKLERELISAHSSGIIWGFSSFNKRFWKRNQCSIRARGSQHCRSR